MGLIKAINHLVRAYRDGNGVQRSRENALFWQKRLAEVFGERYRNSREESDGLDWVRELIELGDCRAYLEDVSGAEEAYRQAYEASRDLVERCGDLRAWRLYYYSLRALGQTLLAEGWPVEARPYLEQAMSVAQGLYGENNLPADEEEGIKRDLLNAFVSMGDLNFKEKKFAEARECYQNAQVVMNLPSETEGELKINHSEIRDLYVIYSSLGDVDYEEGKLNDAWRHYRTALRFIQMLKRIFGELDDIQVVSGLHYSLGKLAEEMGAWADAQENYTQSLEARRELVEKDGTDRRTDFAALYNCLSEVCRKAGSAADAANYLWESLCLRRDVCKETAGTVDELRSLAKDFESLADQYKNQEALLQAAQCWNQAMDLHREVFMMEQQTGDVDKMMEDIDKTAEAGYQIGLLMTEDPDWQRRFFSLAYETWKKLEEWTAEAERKAYCAERLADAQARLAELGDA